MSNNNCDVHNKKHIDSQIYIDFRIPIHIIHMDEYHIDFKIYIDSMIDILQQIPYRFEIYIDFTNIDRSIQRS